MVDDPIPPPPPPEVREDEPENRGDLSGTLFIPTPSALIVESIDLDADAFIEMNKLLEEAMQYRRPPDSLLKKLREAELRFFHPVFGRIRKWWGE